MKVLSRSTTKFFSSCKSLWNIDCFHQSFHHQGEKHKKKHYNVHTGSDHWVAMSIYMSLRDVFDLVKALIDDPS